MKAHEGNGHPIQMSNGMGRTPSSRGGAVIYIGGRRPRGPRSRRPETSVYGKPRIFQFPEWIKRTRRLDTRGKITPRRPLPVGKPTVQATAAQIESQLKSRLGSAAASVVSQVCADMKQNIRQASISAANLWRKGWNPRQAVRGAVAVVMKTSLHRAKVPRVNR